MLVRLLKKFILALSSYKIAYILLILLLLLTFLGTLEQVDRGLYEVKQKYFNSVFLVHTLFDRIPIPLPGGGLLMVLLFLNLLVGSTLRIKKKVNRVGILIVHLGIGFLLVSGFITFAYSFEGHLTLFEDQESNQFQSYYEWEIVISEFLENGEIKDYLISDQSFANLKFGKSFSFRGEGLPFTLGISHYYKNCRPLPKGPMFEVDVPVIDGYFLRELPLEKEAERNVPGMEVTLIGHKNSISNEAILWGRQRYPWTAMIDGKHWTISLRTKRWRLPFTIHLDKFTRELHPRTGIAKVFMSDVTKIEKGGAQTLKITMNEPLRHKGYTLFQASWGPENAKPGEPLFSTFAVVKNPADKFPEYACIIIAFGLLIHFSQKLFRYIKLQNRKTA